MESARSDQGLFDCPAGPFETDTDTIAQTPPQDTPPVKSQQAANSVIPIEISRILDGAISFSQGGLINEGRSTWYAFDRGRHVFIAVLASVGNHSKRAPVAEKLTTDQLLRYTDATGHRRAEFVTLIKATPAQVREFSCLANKLLATEQADAPRPLPADTITKTFSLLHNGAALDLGDGLKRWAIEGDLARFMSQPLQELILQAY